MANGRVQANEQSPIVLSRGRIDLKTKLLTIFVVLTNVLGNVSLSWGVKHHEVQLGFSPFAYIRLICSPWILLGTTLLALWFVSRMTLLGWADLSYVLPTTSISYVFTVLVGRYAFAEEISRQRWMGTLIIMIGIILVGLTRANATTEQPS